MENRACVYRKSSRRRDSRNYNASAFTGDHIEKKANVQYERSEVRGWLRVWPRDRSVYAEVLVINVRSIGYGTSKSR